MEIRQLLTPFNRTIGSSVGRIKYIVIHYIGATGGAEANCKYYASQYVGASAHYFVGFNGEVWQSVEDRNVAWHCGSGGRPYKHPECRNANAIGIELCVRNKGSQADTSRDWYFEDKTVAVAIELTKILMDKYQIPADHVIRHYDVTGKICPNPYVYNHTLHTWDQFKAALAVNKSGWYEEDGAWKFYLGDTGELVRNSWYEDNDKWYWFDASGRMVTNTWYEYDDSWFYLGADGAMVKGLQVVDGRWYYLDADGRMVNDPVTLTPDQNGALQYPGLCY